MFKTSTIRLLNLVAWLYFAQAMSGFREGQIWLASDVLVPEVGSPVGQRLNETKWKWLTDLERQSSINPLVMRFEYEIDKQDFPIRQSLAAQADALPKGLLKRKGDLGVKRALLHPMKD